MAASEEPNAQAGPAGSTTLGRHWQLSPSLQLSVPNLDPINDALRCVFSAFASDSPSATAIELSSAALDDGQLEIRLEGTRVAEVEPRGLAPLLEGSCLGLAMRRMDECVVLHAASLEIGGVGLALLGEKGSGKSTLAMLAAQAGHRFFGDEILPIDPSDGRAFAFPKSITLKRGAFHLLPERAEHEDPVRGTVRYHLPKPHAQPGDRLTLSGIVFPSYTTVARSADLVALEPEEVALPIVQQVFGGLERHPGSLDCVARLSEMPRYHLSFSDGAAAIAALESLAAELRA